MKSRLGLLIVLMISILLVTYRQNATARVATAPPTGTYVSEAEALQALAYGQLIPVSTTKQSENLLPLPNDETSLIGQPNSASAPLDLTGDIVYASDRNGLFNVFIQNAGSNFANLLISSSGNDATPVWSPEGTKVVFASDRDGDFDIYLRDANGLERKLTNNIVEDIHPSWTPDGTRILFSSNQGGGYYQAFTMNQDGSNIQQVGGINNNVMYPRFSPDGSRIAFMRASIAIPACDWNWNIWVMDSNGNNQIQLTSQLGGDIYPNWTPDGRIIYASCRNFLNSDLYIVNPDMGTELRVTSWANSSELHGIYSPDSEHLAFNATIDGNYEVYIGNWSSGTTFNFTENIAAELTPSWKAGEGSMALVPGIVDFVAHSQQKIQEVAANANDVSTVGDYFLDKLGEDAARFAINLTMNSISVAGIDWGLVNQGLNHIATPGYQSALHASWRHWADFRVSNHWYRRLYDGIHNNREMLFDETAWAGFRYYVWEGGEELGKEAIANWLGDRLIPGPDYPFAQYMGQPIEDLGNSYQTELTREQTEILTELAALQLIPEQEEAYLADFQARQLAHNQMLSQLESHHDLLWESYQSALQNESQWWREWGWILLKWAVIGGATLAWDGPGYYVATSGFAVVDLIKDSVSDIRALTHDQKMVDQSLRYLSGRTFLTYDQIALNTVNALNMVRADDDPQIAAATVTAIEMQSLGHYRVSWPVDLWWAEEASQVTLTLTNTAPYTTTFMTSAAYNASGFWSGTQRFLPEGESPQLEGNEQGSATIGLKQFEDGFSPDDGSSVNILVLGATETGLYPVAETIENWVPIRLPISTRTTAPNQVNFTPQEMSDSPSFPYPLSSFVSQVGNSTEQQVHISVINPFTLTVTTIVTQAIPSSALIIDPGDASIVGNSLVWTAVMTPNTTLDMQATWYWEGLPGETLAIPGALLAMRDSDTGEGDIFDAHDIVVESGWPLQISTTLPASWSRSESKEILVSLTNLTQSSDADGEFALSVESLDGTILSSSTLPVDVEPQNTQTLLFPVEFLNTEQFVVVRGKTTLGTITKEDFMEVIQLEDYKVYLPIITGGN